MHERQLKPTNYTGGSLSGKHKADEDILMKIGGGKRHLNLVLSLPKHACIAENRSKTLVMDSKWQLKGGPFETYLRIAPTLRNS